MSYSSASQPSTEQARNTSRFTEGPLSEYEYFSLSPSVSPVPTTAAPPSYGGSPDLARAVPSPQMRSSSPGTSDHQNEKIRNESPSRFDGYPEVVTPHTPQVVPRHSNDKEAYTGATRVQHPSVGSAGGAGAGAGPGSSPYMPYKAEHEQEEDSGEVRPGRRKKKWVIIGVILLIVVIALAVGLGVGLTRNKKSSSTNNNSVNEQVLSETEIGGVIRPQYYSTDGAFNGTGIAITSVNFGVDASIFVFYQKYNGEIIQLVYRADGTWHFVTTVATDAANATALSAVAYIVDSVATWHLFYFDTNRNLKQRTSDNSSAYQTNIWYDGPINSLNLQGNDAEMVGMQACYWGNYYGSSTDFNSGFNVSKTNPSTGMNLWYGRDNSTFEQYDWTHGDTQWNHSKTWTGFNTHAGVGCQSWLTNTTYYVFLVDQSNTLQIFWKDTNTNKTSTTPHPIDQWAKTNVEIPNVHPATSLGYTDFMAYQAADETIHGVNITWAAENTAIAPARDQTASTSDGSGKDEWAIQASDKGVPSTHFAITGLDVASGGRQILVLYQEVGDDILIGKRDSQEGDFSFTNVPVDDTTM